MALSTTAKNVLTRTLTSKGTSSEIYTAIDANTTAIDVN